MISQEFVKGGKAIFTVSVPKTFQVENNTNPHYTFRVDFVEGKNGYKDTYFVKLLTGPDNLRDYTYMGMLDVTTGVVRTTAKSAKYNDSMPLKLLNRVLARIWANETYRITDAGFNVYHIGRCGVCGKPLTTPESVESGIGPICAGK